MVVERLGANSDYRPLPLRRGQEDETDPPLIKAQMSEVSRQLQDLIPELQNLTREMRSLREDRRDLWSSDLPQFRAKSYGDDKTSAEDRQAVSPDVLIKRLRRRNRRAALVNKIVLILFVLGAAASIIAALVLYFYGPDLF